MTPRHSRILATAAAIVLLALGVSRFLDTVATPPVDGAFQRALVTFAVVRGINAVVSVVQGTEVAIEPGGVGVILTPGEVFDPVNDLIERFSWIMLASSTSLGAQRVLLDLGRGWVMQGVLALALVAALTLLWRPGLLPPRMRTLTLRLALLILFLRFAAPTVVLLNEFVYRHFLDARYQASHLALAQTRDDVEALEESERSGEAGEAGSLADRLGRWYDRTTRGLDVERRIQLYKDRLARASEHIIQLIVVFTLQTVVFPILFLWLWLRLLRLSLATP